MSPERIEKGEILHNVAYEENSREETDLYLLTIDMIAGKISFEEWIRLTIQWARGVMQQADNLENRESKKE